VLRGLYAGLDPDEALAGESPQDAIFLLRDGRIERIPCI
jgi:probable phosphoglycerate mutase